MVWLIWTAAGRRSPLGDCVLRNVSTVTPCSQLIYPLPTDQGSLGGVSLFSVWTSLATSRDRSSVPRIETPDSC